MVWYPGKKLRKALKKRKAKKKAKKARKKRAKARKKEEARQKRLQSGQVTPTDIPALIQYYYNQLFTQYSGKLSDDEIYDMAEKKVKNQLKNKDLPTRLNYDNNDELDSIDDDEYDDILV